MARHNVIVATVTKNIIPMLIPTTVIQENVDLSDELSNSIPVQQTSTILLSI